MPALLRAGWRFRARGWYRRPPFLPLPPRKYLDWRFDTAYGARGAGPTDRELERYLDWIGRTGAARGAERASGPRPGEKGAAPASRPGADS